MEKTLCGLHGLQTVEVLVVNEVAELVETSSRGRLCPRGSDLLRYVASRGRGDCGIEVNKVIGESVQWCRRTVACRSPERTLTKVLCRVVALGLHHGEHTLGQLHGGRTRATQKLSRDI